MRHKKAPFVLSPQLKLTFGTAWREGRGGSRLGFRLPMSMPQGDSDDLTPQLMYIEKQNVNVKLFAYP